MSCSPGRSNCCARPPPPSAAQGHIPRPTPPAAPLVEFHPGPVTQRERRTAIGDGERADLRQHPTIEIPLAGLIPEPGSKTHTHPEWQKPAVAASAGACPRLSLMTGTGAPEMPHRGVAPKPRGAGIRITFQARGAQSLHRAHPHHRHLIRRCLRWPKYGQCGAPQ